MALIIVSIIYLASIFSPEVASTAFTNDIKRQSQLMANAIENENLSKVMLVFDSTAALLPEYHHTLEGLRLIDSYYEEFFKQTNTLKYTKTPFEIEGLGDQYYIELGTFEHRYVTPRGKTFDYNGKYTTYWKINAGSQPHIVAHIWGACSYFDTEMVDFIYIHDSPNEHIKPQTDWEKRIEERRAFIHNAVLHSNAEQQLTSYHEDAIYMTYYDPPFIGKDKISDYYRSHYTPGAIRDSLITTNVNVIEMGEYALKFGEYYVSWIFEEQAYFIRGKGLALYKPVENEPIKIYRQMINHSMPASLKSDRDRLMVKRILRHLDNQQLDIDDYLSVYADDKLEIMPPGHSDINSKESFRSYLVKEHEKGSVEIKHKIQDLQSTEQFVIVTGSSEGTFISKSDSTPYPFQTSNFMLFERSENDELKIAKLIWNMVPPNE